jgi:hypothetical protein
MVGSAFATMILMPLIILNIFSGIVGGIWLAIIGQWKLIVAGLVLSFVMPWIYSIVSLPAMGLGMLASSAGERGYKISAFILISLASIYNYALLAGWTLLVLLFFIRNIESGSFVPYLLGGYATAMSPLGYMASKEPPDSTGTSLGFLLAEICFIVLAVLWILSVPFKSTIIIISSLVIVFALVVSTLPIPIILAYRQTEEEEEKESNLE